MRCVFSKPTVAVFFQRGFSTVQNLAIFDLALKFFCKILYGFFSLFGSEGRVWGKCCGFKSYYINVTIASDAKSTVTLVEGVLPPPVFTIKVKLPESHKNLSSVTVKSNICWGGAKGSWSADGKTFGTSDAGLTVTPKDGYITFYISGTYAPDGWANEQKLEGTNFKLSIGADKDLWFNITGDEKQELDWAKGKDK